MAVTDHTEAVRNFNRFYTRRIGVLQENLLDSRFSLTEARVLFELAQRPSMTLSELCKVLELNAGYLSRVLAGFEKRRLVSKKPSPTDARSTSVVLTASGRAAFASLDDASRQEMSTTLGTLAEPARERLVGAMRQIQSLLGERSQDYTLREPRPGDLGLVVSRQAILYAQEYGWDNTYEALVAEIVAKFVRDFDRRSDRCWIAEQDGQLVGAVFVVREDKETARLRLLHVDPEARGLGIGRRLVDECLRFATHAGYRRMMLWTNSVLVSARRIYEAAGFELVEEERHRSFGKSLVGQVWSKTL